MCKEGKGGLITGSRAKSMSRLPNKTKKGSDPDDKPLHQL